MHQVRTQVSKKIPIPRKGTKYVARASSNLQDSVPVVVAIRDMIQLARTAKEVKEMIKNKSLKINGKEVKDLRESIRLFNHLEAGKTYSLSLKPTGKFDFVETKSKERACKVIDKKMLKGKKVQLNLHDGSNILSTDKISVNDTIYLDEKGKITKHVKFEKGKNCFIISGKYIGNEGKIQEEKNSAITVSIDNQQHILEKGKVVVL